MPSDFFCLMVTPSEHEVTSSPDESDAAALQSVPLSHFLTCTLSSKQLSFHCVHFHASVIISAIKLVRSKPESCGATAAPTSEPSVFSFRRIHTAVTVLDTKSIIAR